MQGPLLKTTVTIGKQIDGLYCFEATYPPSSSPSSTFPVHSLAAYSDKKSVLWHHRLGHTSTDKLRHLIPHISDLHNVTHTPCTICPLAKQSRLPFNKSSISSIHAFDLVHCDVWGPYKTPTHHGFRYFLTLVDDYTRNTWCYLIHCKSEVSSILISFFALANNQFYTSIKSFRTDNGTEFLNTTLKSFFTKHGIIHQSSCVSTPQQNGVPERKHRHVLEMARALRFQASLPIQFWGECVLTAT